MAYLNESHIEEANINFFTEILGYTHINAWEKQLLGRKSLSRKNQPTDSGRLYRPGNKRTDQK